MKRLLIVVDYQNNFVNGPLGFREAQEIEQALCDKIDWYHDGGYDVLFTKDTFFENATFPHSQKSISEEKNLEWQLYGRVLDRQGKKDKVLSKHCFGSMDLVSILWDKQYDMVELCGVVSNICVLVNAIICQAALPEAKIIIDADCVASSDSRLHEEALDILENLQIDIMNRK